MMLRFIFLLSIFLTACGGNQSPSSEATTEDVLSAPSDTVAGKQLGMNLDLSKLQSVGIAADKIVVVITKGDFTQIIETTHTDYVASVEFSNLVIGEYIIAVQIFDGDTVVAEGAGLGTVTANQVATVNMDLELKSGGLIVNVNTPIPEEVEYEVLSSEITLLTTSEKLNNAIIHPTGGYANTFPIAEYENNAAYAQLELGAQVQVQYSMSYITSVFNTATFFLRGVESEENTLNIQVGDSALFSCSSCSTDLSAFIGGFKLTYRNIEVEENLIEKLLDVETGEALYDPFGAAATRELNIVDISITVKSIDGSRLISEHISNGDLLDPAKYKTTIKVKNSSSGGIFFSQGYPGLGTFLGSN